MNDSTLQQVITKANPPCPAYVEYPGYIRLAMLDGYELNFGNAGETWACDVCQANEDTVWSFDTGLSGKCNDVDMIAAALCYCMREVEQASDTYQLC